MICKRMSPDSLDVLRGSEIPIRPQPLGDNAIPRRMKLIWNPDALATFVINSSLGTMSNPAERVYSSDQFTTSLSLAESEWSSYHPGFLSTVPQSSSI